MRTVGGGATRGLSGLCAQPFGSDSPHSWCDRCEGAPALGTEEDIAVEAILFMVVAAAVGMAALRGEPYLGGRRRRDD